MKVELQFKRREGMYEKELIFLGGSLHLAFTNTVS
jgi:hypothetical protein